MPALAAGLAYNHVMAFVSIHSILPDAEDLLRLKPEELAGPLLKHLTSLDKNSLSLQLHNFVLRGQSPSLNYPPQYRDQIDRALTEAWVWLESKGLIAPRVGDNAGFMYVTRQGEELATQKSFDSYRHASLFPEDSAHPIIVEKAYPAFLRGEYDTAIFQGFREVEIAVREAGGYSPSEYGVPLMRAAFNVPQGPLTDKTLVPSEQQAMSDLFAGATGLFKNPTSHRSQSGIQPAEAVECLMLASRLLRMVDERKKINRAKSVAAQATGRP